MRKIAVWIGLAGLIALGAAPEALAQGRRPRDFKPPTFEELAKGKDYIVIADVTEPRWMSRSLEKFATENGITDGKITREQFQKYGERARARQAKGPFVLDPKQLGKGPITLDPNQLGKLLTPGKKDAGDPKKGSAEGGEKKLSPEKPAATAEPTRTAEPDPAPTVFRPGKLPKGLPSWFKELDTDKDGQISLYEWRMAKKSLNEFLRMDRNRDGYLSVEEVLRYQKQKRESDAQSASSK
jgi:hypothetical protein